MSLSKQPAARMAFGVAVVVTAMWSAMPAQAGPAVDWARAFALSSGGGLENPALLVGFNPQPEPPAWLTNLDLSDPTRAVMTIPGQTNPQTFDFFIAAQKVQNALPGGAPTYGLDLPSLPADRYGSYSFILKGGVGGDVTVMLGFATSSGGLVDPGSDVAFNPQPEPPEPYADAALMGLQFEFTALSDAIVTLQLFDAAGTALTLAQVPAPAPLALFGLGVAGLSLWQRRRTPTVAVSSSSARRTR